jgi:23S rRNA (cytosine1962-C5)-methyltransferase
MKKGLIAPRAFKNYSAGHPWLRADDIVERKTLPSRPSAFFYGEHWWMCSPNSYLRLRRIGPNQPGWMKNPKLTRITNADQFTAFFGDWLYAHLKQTLLTKIEKMKFAADEEKSLRWVFSENDFIPGLIVDVFGGQIMVAQLLTAPMETFWLGIKPILNDVFTEVFARAPKEFVELRTAAVRKLEELEIIDPPAMAPLKTRWNGFLWNMTPASTQKTGAYLDQRENHRHAADLARQLKCKTAWDICSYQGGFSLHLLGAGLSVTAVDQSQAALDVLCENVQLNPELNPEKLTRVHADAFEWLKAQSVAGSKADAIILDPPSFVKNRENIATASKGYVELNSYALKCVSPQGLFVSCVCSHHISTDEYKKILTESARIAGRTFTIEAFLEASPDHSPAKGFSEGRYLQAWFLVIQ